MIQLNVINVVQAPGCWEVKGISEIFMGLGTVVDTHTGSH